MLQLLFDEESSDSSCGRREIYSDMACQKEKHRKAVLFFLGSAHVVRSTPRGSNILGASEMRQQGTPWMRHFSPPLLFLMGCPAG